LILGHAPAVAAGHTQKRFDARENSGRHDELVERHIVPEPSAVSKNSQYSTHLSRDAGEQLVEVVVQFRVVCRRADEGLRKRGTSLVQLGLAGYPVVQHLVRVIDLEEPAAYFQIEDILLTGDTHHDILNGSHHQGGLRAMCRNGFGRNPGRRGDLRQRRAGVALGREEVSGSGGDALPGLFSLLPAQIGSVSPSRR
jgi:hypothetical protein